MPSLFFPELCQTNQPLILRGDEYHHLTRVLRARPGDTVLLNSGKGSLGKAVIETIDKSSARLQLLSLQTNLDFPSPFAIAFSLLKNRHDELLVEKCTELGAGSFFPFFSQYTIRKAGSEVVSRLQRIALAAIKQCDNPILPDIYTPQSLAFAISQSREQGYIPIICSEAMPDNWLCDLSISPHLKPCFFIGPEGGFSEDEQNLFKQEKLPQISLGYLILRAETAAISIAAQWLIQAKKSSTRGTTK